MAISEPTEEQIAKLPRWARLYITRLENGARAAERSLAEAIADVPEPAIAVRNPYGKPVPVAWGRYDTIKFALNGTLEEQPYPWVSVCRRKESELEISADGELVITPQVSNVVRISVKER